MLSGGNCFLRAPLVCVRIEGAWFGCSYMWGSHRQLEKESSLPVLRLCATTMKLLYVPFGSPTLPNKSIYGSTELALEKSRYGRWQTNQAGSPLSLPLQFHRFLLHELLHPAITRAH
uniref:Uncharacterized protein n=1 Tax=Setaria viridis TaxID=4556 RepID=A0A4U6V1V7_SETVI|nr:hypothetical protein SEVIR_4G157700v2 [Setaria viridis]